MPNISWRNMASFERSPSPASVALLRLFTTLYDDGEAVHDELSHEVNPPVAHVSKSTTQDSQQNDSQSVHTPPMTRLTPHRTIPKARRQDVTASQCFSLATGELVKAPARSKYDEKRRTEVRKVRDIRACLRCRMLKRACSDGLPCRSCATAAQAGANAKALSWMSCIRPQFENMSMLEATTASRKQASIFSELVDIIIPKCVIDTEFPFEIAQITPSARFTDWTKKDIHLRNELVAYHFLQHDNLFRVFRRCLDYNTSRSLLVLLCLSYHLHVVHRRSEFQGAPQIRFSHFPDSDLRAIYNRLFVDILKHIDSRLRPARLEATRDKAESLHALLMVLFGLEIAFSERFLFASDTEESLPSDFKRRTEASLQLVTHYMLYISQVMHKVGQPKVQPTSTNVQLVLTMRALEGVVPDHDAPNPQLEDLDKIQTIENPDVPVFPCVMIFPTPGGDGT